MGKREETLHLKREANSPKSRLLEIMNRMERDGLKREANRLGSIIARLEDWQNS